MQFFVEGKQVKGAVVDLYGGQTASGSGTSYQLLLGYGDVGDVQSLRVAFKANEVKQKFEQIQRAKDQLVLVPKDEWWEQAKSRCLKETDRFLSLGRRNWQSMELNQSRSQSLKVLVSVCFYSHSITFIHPALKEAKKNKELAEAKAATKAAVDASRLKEVLDLRLKYVVSCMYVRF